MAQSADGRLKAFQMLRRTVHEVRFASIFTRQGQGSHPASTAVDGIDWLDQSCPVLHRTGSDRLSR